MEVAQTYGKIRADLGIGPMSTEAIEAAFRYSHYHRRQLMLIPSKNQVDAHGGYVNGWTTQQFMEFVRDMRTTYEHSDVLICRDHCGPGFNGNYDLTDTYDTIRDDIENGFDLIHIDYCHFKGTKDEALMESKKAVEFALSLNPNILLEIGTDENMGSNYNLPNIAEIEREVDYFKAVCTPEFYVVQTGSLVKEINQAGNFNREFTEKIAELLHRKGMKLKEHNDDYLTQAEIQIRKGLVDARNIAPQIGVVQTQLVLTKCLIYGIDFQEFLDDVYASGKWKKWMHNNTPDNKFLCAVIAGHYRFSSESYKKIIGELSEREDIKESIINSLTEIIEHYEQ